MATKLIDRLMFAQGGQCFFCKQPLSKADASVEHLVASANGGGNDHDNCIACCKTVNAMFGSMSLKEKFQVVLNQKGDFRCPNGNGEVVSAASTPMESTPAPEVPPPDKPKKQKTGVLFSPEHTAHVIENLRSRGAARPGTLKTLTASVMHLLQKQLPEKEIASLLKHIEARGIYTVKGEKVSYDFPEST